jgi:CRISPR-associated endonuclease/helicase Cas3
MQGGPYVQEPADLYRDLERVKVHWPDMSAATHWDDLAARVIRHDQALAIVNRKSHARELSKRLTGALYLSTDLCGAHRAERLEEIRLRLAANQERATAGMPICPIHVVSTQLIEAGVDVDFPVVFRALAGLDSIAQAAGRCNREGSLSRGENKVKGEVHVFVPPEPPPSGLLLKGEQAARALLSLNSEPDLAPELFEHYFRLWYAAIISFDEKEVLKDLTRDAIRGCIQFRTAAEKFHLIPDDSAPVIVRWGESEKWLRQLKSGRTDRRLMRKLQRYTVSARKDCLGKLIGCGVNEILPGLYEQTDDLLYDEAFGFLGCAGNIAFDPGKLIVSGEDNDV